MARWTTKGVHVALSMDLVRLLGDCGVRRSPNVINLPAWLP
jgi:hypothetical protein